LNGAANRLEILDASALGSSALADPLATSNLSGAQMNFPAVTQAKVSGADTTIAIGGGANSIAVSGDLLAVAVANSIKTDNGVVMFYNIAGSNARSPKFIKAVQVGSLLTC